MKEVGSNYDGFFDLPKNVASPTCSSPDVPGYERVRFELGYVPNKG